MQRIFFRPDPETASDPPPLCPDDIEGALQDTLAILADIDSAYDERRSAVTVYPGTAFEKRGLLNQIDALHRQEREPYVKRLADLHQRSLFVTLFKTKH